MASVPEIFADTMGEITLSGGMVRIDLVSLTGGRVKEGETPQFETKSRVIMSPDGFLRSFGAMENLVKQLVDAGLVKQKDGGVPPAESPQDSAKSPNF